MYTHTTDQKFALKMQKLREWKNNNSRFLATYKSNSYSNFYQNIILR